MKKTARIISTILCSIIILGILGTIIGAYIQGGINGYSLPDGFDSELEQVDSKQGGDVRIMTSNLLVHYKSWGGTPVRPRARMFIEAVNTYKPDVIGVQEMCGQWYNCLMRNRGSYKMLYPVSTGATMKMTALLYNSDTLTLIDKGKTKYDEGNDARLRRAVWGVFECKKSGKRFAVISTHFDCIRQDEEELMLSYMKTQTKQINEISNNIKEQYGIPVFCVGDLNSKEPGDGVDPIYDAPEIYKSLCQTLTDTKLVAKEKASSSELSADAPTWDHIFLNGKAEINRYAILSTPALTDMSDHYPIFADVTLKSE